jgi:hypothetical protein
MPFPSLRKVHTSEIHLWKIRHQQWQRMVSDCSWKSYQGCFGYIFSACAQIGNSTSGKPLGEIDAREQYL